MKKRGSFRFALSKFYQTVFVGDTQELKFEDRLIILTCLIMTFFGLLSFVTNYFLGFDGVMLGLMLAVSAVFFCFYLIGRFKRISQTYYALVMVSYIAALNIAWYFNYGSRGPVLAMFIILYALFIFVWNKKMALISSAIVFINIILLFFLEWHNPDIAGNYPSEVFRVSDVYLGLFLSLVLMLAFMATVKTNYVKEYMQARKADQLKSAFLANMSHEIRTPLNAIIGFSSLMGDDAFDKAQKDEFKNMIAENSEYLLFLIEDIIDLSKIEAGVLVIKMSDVNLTEIFERLKISFSKSISSEAKAVSIRYRVEPEHALIYTDAFRLEQVLRNLINNAIKFTQKGFIEFGTMMIDGEPTFYVKDTGIGIRPENTEKIFDRFVKVEDGQKNLFRGAGIGLFLSKQLIQKLGGRIWVESEYGTGTTFYFTVGPVH